MAFALIAGWGTLLMFLPIVVSLNADLLAGEKLAQCRRECAIHMAAHAECVKSGGHTDTAAPCQTPCDAMKRVMPYPTIFRSCMSKYKTASSRMCHHQCLGNHAGENFSAMCQKARKRRNGVIQYNACRGAVREAFSEVMRFLGDRLKVVNARYTYLDAQELAAAQKTDAAAGDGQLKAEEGSPPQVSESTLREQQASIAAAAQAAAAAAAAAEAAKLARAAEVAEAKAAAAEAEAKAAKAAAAAAARAAADADAAAAAAAAGLLRGGTN